MQHLSNRVHLFEGKHFSKFVTSNEEIILEDAIFQTVNESPAKFQKSFTFGNELKVIEPTVQVYESVTECDKACSCTVLLVSAEPVLKDFIL